MSLKTSPPHQDYRIIELRVRKDFSGHTVQTIQKGIQTGNKWSSVILLKTSKEGNLTPLQVSPFYWTTLIVRKLFLTLNLHQQIHIFHAHFCTSFFFGLNLQFLWC